MGRALLSKGVGRVVNEYSGEANTYTQTFNPRGEGGEWILWGSKHIDTNIQTSTCTKLQLGLPLLIDNLMGAGSTAVLLGNGLMSKAGRLVNEYSESRDGSKRRNTYKFQHALNYGSMARFTSPDRQSNRGRFN